MELRLHQCCPALFILRYGLIRWCKIIYWRSPMPKGDRRTIVWVQQGMLRRGNMGNLIEALSPEKPVLAAYCPLTPTIVIIDGYSETGKH